MWRERGKANDDDGKNSEKHFGGFYHRRQFSRHNLDRLLHALRPSKPSRGIRSAPASLSPFCRVLQDYLGAIIVFIAVQTALISSYVLPDEASASLVGLALQYTLLIPIYLNWVVKLYADMEMYFGACERISYYIENGYHEQQRSPVEACKFAIGAHNEGVHLMYCCL